MKLYLIWKISISGWSKELIAIFKDREYALKFQSELQSNNQYYHEVNEEETED